MLTSNLSEKQIEAVNAIDDDIEIVACAGADKTDVVARRIINITDFFINVMNLLNENWNDAAKWSEET